jgi:undecaprenyl-diphosphatase
MEGLNRSLFLILNAPAHLGGWRLETARFAAEYPILLLPVLLSALWLWGDPCERVRLLIATAAAVAALALNQAIGLLWWHPRPFALGLGHTYLLHAADNSFPSDHVTVLWAVGFALWGSGNLRALGTMLLGLALAVGWARVYLGVHFPLDVLGAIATASLAAATLGLAASAAQLRLMPGILTLYRWCFAGAIAKGWARN